MDDPVEAADPAAGLIARDQGESLLVARAMVRGGFFGETCGGEFGRAGADASFSI